MLEIDFHQVGDGEKCGDAITARITRPDTGAQGVVIIDSGFQEDGEIVVDHVRRWYGTPHADLVISTHPDADHIGGLGYVLRNMSVGALWAHRPDLHGHPGNSGARPAAELWALAQAQGAAVYEPFTGMSAFGGALVVAGPSVEWYEQMLIEQALTAKAAPSLAQLLGAAVVRTANQVLDALPGETLITDSGGTNPRNNSAAILDLAIDGTRALFTSDAGVPALQRAADYLDWAGRSQQAITFIQAPHHGSRRNLDRATLNRLLGEPHQAPWRTAFVSATEDAPKHPHPKVTNALARRGCSVYMTEGHTICHSSPDAPRRPGWTPLTPLPPMEEDE
jgi:beta-lactamase superfamily II metal-dependent hydrolase